MGLMRRVMAVLLCVFGLSILTVFAQSEPTTPEVPDVTSTPAPATLVPASEDTRLAVCTAPTLPGFVPYIVRPGDRLAELLTGVDNVTVTQIAALNCLDDANWLPIGATLWLPEHLLGIEVAFPVDDTNPDVDNAVIASFRANADVVTNEQGVTLSWAAEGSEAYLYTCPLPTEYGCSRPFGTMQVPLAHSVTINGFQYDRRVHYRLEVVDGDAVVYGDVEVQVVCAQRWIAPTVSPERCAEVPAQPVFAAWQPLEGGILMWFSDTRQIYVLFNEGQRVQVFGDPYNSQPEPTITPPVGMNAPVRGFGLVWQELGAAEGELGWGTQEEIGFDSARQQAGRQSYTTYIQGPGATVYAVTLTPGTDGGFWTQVAG
jgi:hypothetical protein